MPDDEAAVITRYLTRHRRARSAGGLLGVAFAVVVGIRFQGSVGVGSGRGSPFSDLLFCGIAGVVLGALSAEVGRIPRPAGAVAEASLAPRAEAPHARMVLVARVLIGLAVVVGVVLAMTGRGTGPLVAALLGAAVIGVAELARARVVGRARPVMSARAARLDQRLRRFATGSLAHLEVSTAVLAVSWFGSAIPDGGAWLVIGLLMGFGGLVVAVVLLVRAAPRPPPEVAGSMIVRVDPSSAVPVFEQLRVQIQRLVLFGGLAPGTNLPTIRNLAADLAVSRGTVARVYDELAREGWVRSAGRHGTVVQGPPTPRPDAAPSDLAAAADELAIAARQHGLDAAAAHEARTAALARW